jgi:hypothetical protein
MANGWTPERRARQAQAILQWKPWMRSTGRASGALNILDRYHIAAKMNQAIDDVRAKETKDIRAPQHESVGELGLW